MRRSDYVRELVNGIKLDIKQYQKLKSLLRYQHRLVEKRDADTLEQHNPRVEQLCQVLQNRAHRRSELLCNLGLPGDSKGMQRLLNAIPGDKRKKIDLLWRQLQQLVHECKAQNDINGTLINSQKRILNRVINPDQASALENDYGQLSR